MVCHLVLSKSDSQWYSTAIQSGTFKDKIGAYTLLIGSSPMYHVKELRIFMGMIAPSSSDNDSKVGRKESNLETMEALLDLFLNNILPNSRKLKLLEQRTFHDESFLKRQEVLLSWYIEDLFKRAYVEFLQIVQAYANDPIFYIKSKSIHFLFLALSSNPEQESLLLSFLVHKLGDPNRKLASKIAYLLNQLVLQHPNMAEVVINQVYDSVIGTSLQDKHTSMMAR